jgi:uncharacterized protein
MNARTLRVGLLPETLAVCRLKLEDGVPAWALRSGFASVTRTQDVLSVVCAADCVPADVHASVGWRALKIEGPLDLELVGILVSIAVPLAQAGVAILPVGTFDTDYILVQEDRLSTALEALRATGLDVNQES